MFIQNVSLAAFQTGAVRVQNPDIVIRILDTVKVPENPNFPNLEFGDHPFPNAEVYCFRFDDTTDDTNPNRISESQAHEIFDILEYAICNNKNVIVHCVMGSCRSGAVTHAAIALSQYLSIPIEFDDRSAKPNALVKTAILKDLWGY